MRVNKENEIQRTITVKDSIIKGGRTIEGSEGEKGENEPDSILYGRSKTKPGTSPQSQVIKREDAACYRQIEKHAKTAEAKTGHGYQL